MTWLRRLLGLAPSPESSELSGAAPDDPEEAEPKDLPELTELVVELPITEALDLHPFLPKETADVLRAYLDGAIERGFREVRIIHGRGIGMQREIVRKVLLRDPRVVAFADAPADRGGWGATVAQLSHDPRPEPSSGPGER
jgi:dsDNA-specific endonuclease/ATPase MutS2